VIRAWFERDRHRKDCSTFLADIFDPSPDHPGERIGNRKPQSKTVGSRDVLGSMRKWCEWVREPFGRKTVTAIDDGQVVNVSLGSADNLDWWPPMGESVGHEVVKSLSEARSVDIDECVLTADADFVAHPSEMTHRVVDNLASLDRGRSIREIGCVESSGDEDVIDHAAEVAGLAEYGQRTFGNHLGVLPEQVAPAVDPRVIGVRSWWD